MADPHVLKNPKQEAAKFKEEPYTASLEQGAPKTEYAKDADSQTGPNDPGYGAPGTKK
jgi:hypothetical protein